ncbi:MAG: hypothetical protein JO037_22555, partial [Actinobacteria bacterium]|nr:hypothetical protein [Actinomycetota bacterium]
MPDIVPRRRMLAASAAALPWLLAAAGCRSQDVFTGPDPLAGRPPLGHNVVTLQAVIAAEQEMVGLYRTAVAGEAETAARSRALRPLLAQHEQHLTQLRARLIQPAGAPAPVAASGPPARSAASAAPARV